MEVFWLNGFQGSSIAALTQAMGVKNAPSLYMAFGSKEQLFLEALDLYLGTQSCAAWEALEKVRPVTEAVRIMLTETVKLFSRAATPRGCLLILGDKAMAPASAAIQDAMRAQRMIKRRQLARRLQRAVEERELPASVDAQALAGAIFMFMSGISIETADGTPESQLIDSVNVFMSHWLGVAPPS
jgi:AcrR family transcriptional regulator